MGVILPKPITSKVVDRVGSPSVAGACCSINGFRNSMEDAHCMIIGTDRMLFGVFDGHSNDKCSQYIAEHLPGRINAQPMPIPDATMEKICLDLDAQFLEDVGDGGTTATFVVVEPTPDNKYKVQICNVGDSRTLIVRDGKLLFSTEDHKPQNPSERQRIERAGGTVRMNRVDGDLAVSRAFGDGVFKKTNRDDPRAQKVVAVPEITHYVCQPGDILLLACDGVFEGTFPNEDVVAFVTKELPPAGGDYAVVASRVCDQAVRRGSKDNISCMIIHFADGQPMLGSYGASSFVPGPPYPKSHDGARQAYFRMASIAGKSLADALQMRYELLQAYLTNRLSTFPPLEQTAFEMSDDVDIETEKAFFGAGPANGNDKSFFAALADIAR